MLVTEFCENRTGDLPDSFYECLPQYCTDCHHPMEMTEAFTQLHCSNPKCPSKMAQRLIAMANQLGVKDLGESKAIKFIEKCENEWGIRNPLMIFGYTPDEDGTLDGVSLEVCNKVVNQFKSKNKFTLAEYVRVAQLPFIQTSALTLFGDFDDLEEAYEKIESEGISYIRSKLGIKEDVDNISIRALKIYETLMSFKDDLFEALPFVEIIKTSNIRKLVAVCSDEVGSPYKTKADFYATVNNTFKNTHVEFSSSVTKNIDYLVWAGADGSPARYTNKVKKVEAYNAKGDVFIPIVTASQFMEILKNMEEA